MKYPAFGTEASRTVTSVYKVDPDGAGQLTNSVLSTQVRDAVARLATTLKVILIVTLAVLAGIGCDTQGSGYGKEREAYLEALFRGDFDTAFALLCEPARLFQGSAAALGASFESIRNEHRFLDSWASLRGEPATAYTTFFGPDGAGQYSSRLPVVYAPGGDAEMCPEGDDILGKLKKL